MATTATLLARGPWDPGQISVAWREEPYEPPARATEAADAAVSLLHDRGSPSHDGVAARLVAYEVRDGGLALELQPARWSLRLSGDDAHDSMSVHCVVRAADGRWLAGRRAQWLATWAGVWALGAAGSVEVGENPAETLARELREEWSVEPERLRVEALVRLSSGLVMLLAQAWLVEGASVTPDEEHDEYAWWPADPAQWPDDAHEPLRRTATLLALAR